MLLNLVSRDLKVRYKRSVLGVVWTLLNPLLMMLVLGIVFSNVMRLSMAHFTVYFLSAFVLWNFVAQTTSWSTACLLGYAPLIRKIYVPKSIFILATVLSGLVNLLISLIPLAGLMLVVSHPLAPSILFLPVPIFLATLFAFGLSLLLASICIEFNDVVQIYAAAQLAWMYLTPVIYPLEAVPVQWHWVIKLNPMFYLVEAFRQPIYGGVLPSATLVGICTLIAVTSVVVGWTLFERRADRIAYLV